MMEHHKEVLRRELSRPEYAGKSADEVYVLLTDRREQVKRKIVERDTGGIDEAGDKIIEYETTPSKLINTQTPAEFRMTRARFYRQSYWDALREKDRQRILEFAAKPKHDFQIVVMPDEVFALFRTERQVTNRKGETSTIIEWDIPGFPGKVRRHEFDEVWKQLKNK